MKDIIKAIPASKDKILALAGSFKARFSGKPRRPAMLEELAKLP